MSEKHNATFARNITCLYRLLVYAKTEAISLDLSYIAHLIDEICDELDTITKDESLHTEELSRPHKLS